MSNTNTNEKSEIVIIEKTLFDTMYKKKIGIKDAIYTKSGLIATLLISYLAVEGHLSILYLVFWVVFIFYIIKRSDVLAHTKDRHLWGKKFLFQLFRKFEEKKNVIPNNDVEIILKECRKRRKVKKVKK